MKATTTIFFLLLCSILGHSQATYKASKTASGYELVTTAAIDTTDAPKDALGGRIKAQSTVITLSDSAEASNYLLNVLTKTADQIAESKARELALEKDHNALSKEYNSVFGANAYERAIYRLFRDAIGDVITIRSGGDRVAYDLEKPNGQAFSFNIKEGTASKGRLVVYSANLVELRNWNGVKSIQLYGSIQDRSWVGESPTGRVKITVTAAPQPRQPGN